MSNVIVAPVSSAIQGDGTVCPDCGAPRIEVVTSVKYGTRGLVCSAGWNAVYSRSAFACGAARSESLAVAA